MLAPDRAAERLEGDQRDVHPRAPSRPGTSGCSPTTGKYVGVEESRSSIEDLVTEHVDPDAERGKDVTIAGETWQTWTDAGGDYALAAPLKAEADHDGRVVARRRHRPGDQIRDFAGHAWRSRLGASAAG